MTKILEVLDPSTILVSEHVPDVDRRNVSEVFANRVVADGVMAVVSMAVIHNKDRPTDTILGIDHPSTIVFAELVLEVDLVRAAELFANRRAAEVVMEVDKLFFG